MPNICWFQLSSLRVCCLSLFLYYCKLNMFGFLNCQIEKDVKDVTLSSGKLKVIFCYYVSLYTLNPFRSHDHSNGHNFFRMSTSMITVIGVCPNAHT